MTGTKQDILQRIPPLEELEAVLKKEKHRKKYFKTFRSTIYILLIVAAIVILISTLFMPVLRIYGTSMTPTLTEGEIAVANAHASLERGDVVAFYYNNKIMIKRVIGVEGDIVNIDSEGNVEVNGERIDEPYLVDKAYGDKTTTKFPCEVPMERYFLMGDNRKVSVDSRNENIGPVAKDQILGKLTLIVWPLKDIRTLSAE